MPISVNMFGLRLTKDAHIRTKKSHPAQSTTGVANSNSTHGCTDGGSTRCSGAPGIISPIAITKTGTVRTSPIQNLRVMSESSGFASSSAVAVRGSRAIPQIGHGPGAFRTISGCIGQV
jgi:hypothetical protein